MFVLRCDSLGALSLLVGPFHKSRVHNRFTGDAPTFRFGIVECQKPFGRIENNPWLCLVDNRMFGIQKLVQLLAFVETSIKLLR